MRQETDTRHPTYHREPTGKKGKKVKALFPEPKTRNLNTQPFAFWNKHLTQATHTLSSTRPWECLPSDASESWSFWHCLNRLRTAVGRCKTTLTKWGLKEDGDISCQRGSDYAISLCLPLIQLPCTQEDLAHLTPSGKQCTEHWTGSTHLLIHSDWSKG